MTRVRGFSLTGAEQNLRAEVRPNATVGQVAAQGYTDWRRELNAIRVTGGTDAQRTTFYTALYHALLGAEPSLWGTPPVDR